MVKCFYAKEYTSSERNDLNTVVDGYFLILRDYFDKYEIASRNKFRKEKYRLLLKEIYDDVLVESTLDSLFDDLIKLDWKNQEKSIREKGGRKSSLCWLRIRIPETCLVYIGLSAKNLLVC